MGGGGVYFKILNSRKNGEVLNISFSKLYFNFCKYISQTCIVLTKPMHCTSFLTKRGMYMIFTQRGSYYFTFILYNVYVHEALH